MDLVQELQGVLQQKKVFRAVHRHHEETTRNIHVHKWPACIPAEREGGGGEGAKREG